MYQFQTDKKFQTKKKISGEIKNVKDNFYMDINKHGTEIERWKRGKVFAGS